MSFAQNKSGREQDEGWEREKSKELAFGGPIPTEFGTWTRQAESNQEKECRSDVGVEDELPFKGSPRGVGGWTASLTWASVDSVENFSPSTRLDFHP